MTIPRAAIPLSASVDHQQKHESLERVGASPAARRRFCRWPAAVGRRRFIRCCSADRRNEHALRPAPGRIRLEGRTYRHRRGADWDEDGIFPGRWGGDCALNLQGLAHSPEVRTGRAPRRLRATGRGRGAARPGGNAAPLGRLSQFQLRSTYGCGRTAVLICPLLSVSRPSLSTDDRAAPQMIDFVLI